MRRSKKPVVILGCGPAGLFAAQAAQDLGHPVIIFSKKRKSEMFGAQYLHGPVPNVPARQFLVDYKLRGTALGYAAKVYGLERAEEMAGKVSPSRLLGRAWAWDIRAAYDTVWERFEPNIVHASITPAWFREMAAENKHLALVVSSVPTSALCFIEESRGYPHAFRTAQIWASGDAPARGTFCPVATPLDTVICNGEKSPGWYRASNINGVNSAEWPIAIKPPFDNVAIVEKPISTDCNCWTDSRTFIRVGRYGTWTKGILSHDSYQTAWEALS